MKGKGFYIIIRERSQGGQWLPAEYPYQHADYGSALKEARRLAGDVPGERFYVFQARASAVRQQPVTVTEFETDEIPF